MPDFQEQITDIKREMAVFKICIFVFYSVHILSLFHILAADLQMIVINIL
jgi:hypothetical protein